MVGSYFLNYYYYIYYIYYIIIIAIIIIYNICCKYECRVFVKIKIKSWQQILINGVLIVLLVEVTQLSLCSQINPRVPGMLEERIVPSRDGKHNLLPRQSLGCVWNLTLRTLWYLCGQTTVDAPPEHYHMLAFLSQSTKPIFLDVVICSESIQFIFMESFMCTWQRFSQ